MPARRARELHTPNIHPVAVVFLVTRERVTHPKSQRAVDGAETSCRGRSRLDAWRQATFLVAGTLLSGGGDGGVGGWTWKCDRPHHRQMMSPNPSQHSWCRNRKTPCHMQEQMTPWRLLGQLSLHWLRQRNIRNTSRLLADALLSNMLVRPHSVEMGGES